MLIGKTFTFEAAHQLPNHDGKCRGLHGHSYRVELVLEGDRRDEGHGFPDEGMVIDFTHVSAAFKDRVFSRLDHQYLNDVLNVVTTAENLACWIYGEMAEALASPSLRLVKVTVWETATSWASYQP